MADKTTSGQIVRQLNLAVLSISTLAGSGWGIYEYQNAESHSKTVMADQSNPSREETTSLRPSMVVRNAPIPDPSHLADTNPIDVASSLNSDFKSTRTSSKVTPTAVVASGTQFVPVAPSQENMTPDVARGQEPINPLRSTTTETVSFPAGKSTPPEKIKPATQTTPPVEKTSPGQKSNRPSMPVTNPIPQGRYAPSDPSGVDRYQPKSLPNAKPSSRESGSSDAKQGAPNPTKPNSAIVPTNQGANQSLPRYPAAPFALDSSPSGTEIPALPQLKSAPESFTNQPAPRVENQVFARDEGPSQGHTPAPGIARREGTGQPGENQLEGIQNPSITIEKLAPPEIQVGKKCTFAIRVQNIGQQPASQVSVHDEIPKGTQLLGSAPRAKVVGSKLAWELGTLGAGEERIVEVELLPIEEGILGSIATVLFATQASAKALSTRPELTLSLSCNQPKVLAGDQQQIQIELSNPGSGDATGVLLMATLPPHVSHPSGSALELEVGTLAAGESRQIELILNAEKAGRIESIMTARADANLQTEARCEFEITAAQLHVEVHGPVKRFLERPATYQLRIENPGTASAQDVQLVTHLPKGLQFVKANNMGEYHAATHTVHWNLTELPANQKGEVELVTLPVETGEQTLQIDTQAGQGLVDHTEKRVRVEGLAAVKFEVVDTEDPIEVGGESDYKIRLTNQGSKSATNVKVVAILPPGMRAVSATGETAHKLQGERVTFAPIARLDPKKTMTYQIRIQGIQPGNQRVRVQVTTNDMQQPITKEEGTLIYSDQE